MDSQEQQIKHIHEVLRTAKWLAFIFAGLPLVFGAFLASRVLLDWQHHETVPAIVLTLCTCVCLRIVWRVVRMYDTAKASLEADIEAIKNPDIPPPQD